MNNGSLGIRKYYNAKARRAQSSLKGLFCPAFLFKNLAALRLGVKNSRESKAKYVK